MRTKNFLIVIFIILSAAADSFLIRNCFSQWVQVSSGMNNIRTIYCLCASGSNIFAGVGSNGIFLSTNSGLNWIQTGLTSPYVVNDITISGNNIFAAAHYTQYPYSDEDIFLSTNNGISWISLEVNQYIYSLTSNGSSIFAGVYYSGIYRSTNNGTNWIQTSLINKRVDALSSNGNNLFAGTNGSGLYMSTNSGTNWANIGFNYENVNSVTANGSNIYASIEWSGIYFSTDYGANWTQSDLLNTRSDALVIYGNNIFAGNYASGGLGGVYMSTNNGINFIDISQGLNGHPTVHSLCISNNYIFAGLDSQSVWRRSLSEIIGIKNISSEIPSTFSLEQNYPNPFNSNTIIRFQIKDSRFVNLKVFDILGKEVATLVNEYLKPGTYETTLDASTLTGGIYFYRLQTDKFTATKKLILLK